MYPFIRFFSIMARQWRKPRMGLDDTFAVDVRVWPHDIDIFLELNNGRTLTLMDLSRVPFGKRIGIMDAMRANGWAFTIAGSTLRYRRRVKAWAKVRITTRAIGRDDRFVYLLQTMWQGEEAAHSGVFRAALYNKDGIVNPQKLADYLGYPDWNPKMPDWVEAWKNSENQRDWPPSS